MSLKEGKLAEEQAVSHLLALGYTILTCNFHSKFGEIDIVAQKEGVIHFCEVKFSQKYDPLWRITPSKIDKIMKTIGYYFLRYPSWHNYQMDAILVTPEGIEILKNITYS